MNNSKRIALMNVSVFNVIYIFILFLFAKNTKSLGFIFTLIVLGIFSFFYYFYCKIITNRIIYREKLLLMNILLHWGIFGSIIGVTFCLIPYGQIFNNLLLPLNNKFEVFIFILVINLLNGIVLYIFNYGIVRRSKNTVSTG